MPGRQLDVRLFLEGIQVPFMGANINITTNQASTATINVVPTNVIFGIRPKTHVLLVFWDEAGRGAWRMLWEGQVIGVGSSKSPDSRSVQLTCRDLSNYWDYILRFMVDQHNAPQISTEKLYFYGNDKRASPAPKETKVPMDKQPVTSDLLNTILSIGNLPDALKSLLNDFSDRINVYKMANKAYRLNDQLVLKEDKNVEALLVASKFEKYVKNIEGSLSGFTPVREVILAFCQLIYYNIVSVPAAPYNASSNALGTFILKPNLYGTLPPACNVVLPDLCTSISYNRNFMAEPTRMLVHTSPYPNSSSQTPGGLFQPAYAVPENIFQKLNRINPPDERLSAEYGGGLVPSEEEKEKGILSAESNISFPDFFAMTGLNESKDDKEVRLAAMRAVNYRFQMARYANRSLSVVTDLNPWLVCNFPALVCDSSRSFIGVIANINHTITASGGGYTQFDCNLSYEVSDPGVKNGSDVEDREQAPGFPGWLNESYQPKKVNETYKGILGCQAMEGDKASSLEYDTPDLDKTPATDMDGEAKQAKISDLVLGLYNPFDKNKKKTERRSSKYASAVEAGSAYSFADAYRRRSIATIKDLSQFYGFTSVGTISPEFLPAELNSTNEYFLESRKKVIRKYMDDADVGLRENRVMDGR